MLVASDYNFKSNEELSISIGILYTIIHYITLIKLSYILLTSNKLLKYHCACMHSFVCVCGRLESGNQTKLLMPLMSLFELHYYVHALLAPIKKFHACQNCYTYWSMKSIQNWL